MTAQAIGETTHTAEEDEGGRICDREHIGCGGLCKVRGNSSGEHSGPHGCNKCGAAW